MFNRYTVALFTLLALMACQVQSKIEDYSGHYNCTGKDAHEGHYTGTVKMVRQPQYSQPNQASYSFSLDVPGYGLYLGYAIVRHNQAAIYFGLPGQKNQDYGVGIAEFSHDSSGHVQFDKFYYEPEFKGGNTGSEHCIRQ